jgi:hypothetical protein
LCSQERQPTHAKSRATDGLGSTDVSPPPHPDKSCKRNGIVHTHTDRGRILSVHSLTFVSGLPILGFVSGLPILSFVSGLPFLSFVSGLPILCFVSGLPIIYSLVSGLPILGFVSCLPILQPCYRVS